MTYLMTINCKGRAVKVSDYAEASKRLISEQERLGYRSPKDRTIYPRFAHLRETAGGPVVAHVSQNGKVWAGLNWTPDSEPLFVPGN